MTHGGNPIHSILPFSNMSSLLLHMFVYMGIIYLLHKLYQYLVAQLTTPTKRNMIQLHEETYQDILEQLKPPPVYSSSSQEIQLYQETASVLTEEQKDFLKQSLTCHLHL
jgi:hypothetical protein